MVDSMRKKPQIQRIKRVNRYKTTTDEPPIGAPSWCLNQEALERFNRPTNNIPVYDYDTEESQEHDNSDHNDIEDDNEANKRKRKNREKSKKKKEKKRKSKKRST